MNSRSTRALLITLIGLVAFWWVVSSKVGAASRRGLLAIVVLSVSIVGLSYLESRIRRKKLFAARHTMSPEQVFSEYFSTTDINREVMIGLWLQIARRLGVPADKLRPTDRFTVELVASGSFDPFDGTKDQLAAFADSYAKSHGISLDLTKVETVGDLIQQMAGPATQPA